MGPAQLCHTAFITQRLQIRQGSLTRRCALSLTHTHTHTHTALQYVKCERDGNGFCLTPDCFVTDKCATRAKGRACGSKQNTVELLCHILKNHDVQINQLPLPAQMALTETPGGDGDAASALQWRIVRDVPSNRQVSLPVYRSRCDALTARFTRTRESISSSLRCSFHLI